MEVGMAPPHKRRKLSESSARDSIIFESETAQPAHTPTTSHDHEHLPHVHAVSGVRQVPQRIEEVHLQIHQLAVGAADSHHELHPRQGTGVSSEHTLAVTVVASVDIDGSTTGLATSTDSAAASGVSSFASTATTTVVSSAAPTGSTSTSSDAETTSESSSSDISTASSSDTSSATSTDNSTESTTSTPSPTSGSGSTASGVIGNSPSDSATSTTNSTSDSVSQTASLPSLATLSGSVSRNLTTSAIIFLKSSTTYTSQTTINLDSSTTRTASRASESSSQTLGAAFFLTTLRDNTVETMSRSSEAYVTTLPDGEVATVPAATGSYVTATGTDGATSIVYETTSAVNSGADQSTITSIATIGAAGQPGTATSSTHHSKSTSSGGGGNSSNTSAPPGTIAGGVVGGAAGLAVILLIAMLFLRWYRRRSQLGHQALPPNAGVSPDPDHSADVSRGGPGMAERAGLMPALGVVPALFRHQNRSREGPPPSERSFTRVSGRKLPSSFSPGMSTNSPPPTMPLTGSDRNLSTTSFYRDSAGFYGGTDSSTPGSGPPHAAAAANEEFTLSPGPQRRPTVHTGGPYVMSPPGSSPTSPRLHDPNSPPGTAATTATFDRSETPSSLDPSRGSRFTEEV